MVATTGNRFNDRLRSERGVSLIQIALAITVLTGFSAFVVDHGVMLLARGQAQNVADAAAIAGVTTRVMDEPGDADPAANGLTEKNILNSVSQHAIFGGTSGNIGKTWSWTCPTGVTGWCVTVNVFRDGTNSSTTLPVFFGPVLGATSMKVRATATAVAVSANGTRCMKPWLIPDRYVDVVNPPNQFNTGDEYVPPSTTDPSAYTTGYTIAHIGTPVVLKPGNPSGTISPGDFFEIEDANDYEESIAKCVIEKRIGETVTALPGNRVGPTNSGVDTLLANGPVTITVGMFSPSEFAAQDRQSGTFTLTIVNLIGVTITARQGNQIEGFISGAAGEAMGGASPVGNANLVKHIQLVR
jgi:Flp pilus assembly protein TadG